MQNTDDQVNAGTDYYRFVNQEWLATNPVPAEYGAWGAFHEVTETNETVLRRLLEKAASSDSDPGTPSRMAGNYWRAGLDADTIEASGFAPLAEFLSVVDRIDDHSAFLPAVSELRRGGISVLIGADVAPDFEHGEAHLLYLGEGGLGLPERDYYFRQDDLSVELRKEYVTLIGLMLRLIGEVDEAIGPRVFEFEKELAAITLTPVEARDIDLTTNKTNRDEWADTAPGIDLCHFVDTLAGSELAAINIDNTKFFANLGDVINKQPIDVLRAYLRWNIVRSTATALSSQFVEAHFEFYEKRIGGRQELRPRWKRVLSAATVDIGQQVSKLFVAETFTAVSKERCEQLVEYLLDAMSDAIDGLEWMGSDTKAAAKRKLARFSYKIGYPDDWLDYDGLLIDQSGYLGNRVRAGIYEARRNIAKLGQPVEDKDWALAPHVVNAYYHPLLNEIVFPAAILQPPFFHPDAADAANFGAIGTVIGHEIIHGFDDRGSKFDEFGQLRNWWATEDRKAFETLAARLVDQYSSYEPLPDLKLNGELTLGENIADLGGVGLAFAALEKALGEDFNEAHQREFFAAYATMWRTNYTEEYTRLMVTSDPHSPSAYRCNGVLGNFLPFAVAFELDESAPIMIPAADRVKIW